MNDAKWRTVSAIKYRRVMTTYLKANKARSKESLNGGKKSLTRCNIDRFRVITHVLKSCHAKWDFDVSKLN